MTLIALVLAAFGGLFFGLLYPAGMRLLGIPMDGVNGLRAGLLFGGMAFIAIVLLFRWQQHRFRKAVEKLPSPHTHAFSLPMLHEGKSRAMAVFLCEDCLCLVDTDKRSLPITIYPAEEIIRTRRINARQLELHLTQDRVLTFCSGGSEVLHRALQERGWLPLQH